MDPASTLANLLKQDLPDGAKEHLQIALNLLRAKAAPEPAGLPATDDFFKIPGYGKRYAINEHGDIFSYSRKRLLKPWENDRDQYLRVDLTPDEGGRQKKELVHNLVILTFKGVRPPNHVVRHLDDDPRNNSLENLSYGTRAQNAADLVRNDGRPRRFSEEKEEDIRHKHFFGETQADLAKEYGCSSRTIWKVVNYKYSDGSA